MDDSEYADPTAPWPLQPNERETIHPKAAPTEPVEPSISAPVPMSSIRIALALAWERIETSAQSDQTVAAIERLQSWLAVCGEVQP
jgi:hypothetical protein